jgi:hypothetical protein
MEFEINATYRLKATEVVAAPQPKSYEEVFDKIGFKRDPKKSGSRGMYFISSWIPSAAAQKKGWSGRIEVHTDAGSKPIKYEIIGSVVTPDVSVNFDLKGKDPSKLAKDLIKKLGIAW